jgi:hypothetical protein
MLATVCPAAGAQDISLPLQGYYRPGRYMPVETPGGRGGDGGGGAITLESAGAIPTLIAPQAPPGVVPLLTLDDEPSTLHAGSQQLPLHALAAEDALVASTGDATQLAAALLPGRTIVSIRLDPGVLLSGVPVAWESLDALLLDADSMRRIDDARRSALLSAGVMLAAVGRAAPDSAWPWRTASAAPGLWVLGHTPAGPTPCICGSDGYLPTLGWNPTWPAPVRRTIAGAAVVLALLVVLAAAKVRQRWALPAVAALCIAATAGAAVYRRSLGPVYTAGGDILVADAAEQLAQRDAWLYQRSHASGQDCIVPFTGPTHPLLTDPAQASAATLRLHVTSDGHLQFVYRTTAAGTLAFMRRDTTPLASHLRETPPRTLADSPMAELARQVYLTPGVRVIGEAPGPAQRWPSIVLGR